MQQNSFNSFLLLSPLDKLEFLEKLSFQKIFQIIGGKIGERTPESKGSQFSVSEEDTQLVADQTGKSLEEAKNALEECEGDLAKAILLLQS